MPQEVVRWCQGCCGRRRQGRACQHRQEGSCLSRGPYVRSSPVVSYRRTDSFQTVSSAPLDTTYLTDDEDFEDDTKRVFATSSAALQSLSTVALVAKPPIPFAPNAVIRGRRTMSPTALLGTLFSPKGRVRKVHCCPAENCGAAFKRSEHLKRHYRAVHVGAKRESRRSVFTSSVLIRDFSVSLPM